MQPEERLLGEVQQMEAFLRRDVAEFDRVKVRLLLAETYWMSGERSRASKHAKSVGSRRGLEEWAKARTLPSARQPE